MYGLAIFLGLSANAIEFLAKFGAPRFKIALVRRQLFEAAACLHEHALRFTQLLLGRNLLVVDLMHFLGYCGLPGAHLFQLVTQRVERRSNFRILGYHGSSIALHALAAFLELCKPHPAVRQQFAGALETRTIFPQISLHAAHLVLTGQDSGLRVLVTRHAQPASAQPDTICRDDRFAVSEFLAHRQRVIERIGYPYA